MVRQQSTSQTYNHPLSSQALCKMNLDLLYTTETWIRDNSLDSQVLNELTPAGFAVHSVPRTNKRGGGVAVVYRSTMKLSVQDVTSHASFEYLKVHLSHSQHLVSLWVVYRPPTTGMYPTFLAEFEELVGEIQTSPGVPLLVGDFNVHVNVPSDNNSSKFLSLLESANLVQHVTFPTHQRGHTLDLIITRANTLMVDRLLSNMSVSSDHWSVLFQVCVPKPAKPVKTIVTRKWKNVDIQCFASDLQSMLSPECLTSSDSAVEHYNTTLSLILEKHAPSIHRQIVIRPNTEWFTSEMKAAKRVCRKLERQYNRTGLILHQDM